MLFLVEFTKRFTKFTKFFGVLMFVGYLCVHVKNVDNKVINPTIN